jgi:hypothetical protein
MPGQPPQQQGPGQLLQNQRALYSAEHGYVQGNPQPGYGPPGYGPPPHGAPREAALTGQKGFFAGIFDFSFTIFVTTRIIKVLYCFYLVAVALMFVGGIVSGLIIVVGGASAESAGAAGVGLLQIIMAPIVALIALIYGRVLFECIAVFFRVAEQLGEINRKTKE